MNVDIGCLSDGVRKLREIQTFLEQQKHEFAKQVDEAVKDITKRADEMMRKVEQDKQTLLDELAKKRCDTMKQLDNVHHEIVQQVSFMENLKKYAEELSLKGSPGDIARETNALKIRTAELLKLHTCIEQSGKNLDSVSVRFTHKTVDSDNIIGKFEVTSKGLFVNMFH